jgi:predicted thioredoxin/glutaredoxin
MADADLHELRITCFVHHNCTLCVTLMSMMPDQESNT